MIYFHNLLRIVLPLPPIRAAVPDTSPLCSSALWVCLRSHADSEILAFLADGCWRVAWQIQKRRWFFAQLRQYLTRHHGDNAEEKAFSSMERALVKCLLVAESSLAVYFGGMARNPNENLYRFVALGGSGTSFP